MMVKLQDLTLIMPTKVVALAGSVSSLIATMGLVIASMNQLADAATEKAKEEVIEKTASSKKTSQCGVKRKVHEISEDDSGEEESSSEDPDTDNEDESDDDQKYANMFGESQDEPSQGHERFGQILRG